MKISSLFFDKEAWSIYATLQTIVILFIIHRIKVEYYSRIGSLIFFCSIACLIFLLLAPDHLIPEHNYITNARRWLSIPFTNNKLTFQPSDIAKIGIVMYFGHLIGLSGRRTAWNATQKKTEYRDKFPKN